MLVKGLSKKLKKEKELMDMEHSVVTAGDGGGRRYMGDT